MKPNTNQVGSRKVILTKWAMIILCIITVAYLAGLVIAGQVPPESFFMNFVLALSVISGGYTVGNIFEHMSSSKVGGVMSSLTGMLKNENNQDK